MPWFLLAKVSKTETCPLWSGFLKFWNWFVSSSHFLEMFFLYFTVCFQCTAGYKAWIRKKKVLISERCEFFSCHFGGVVDEFSVDALIYRSGGYVKAITLEWFSGAAESLRAQIWRAWTTRPSFEQNRRRSRHSARHAGRQAVSENSSRGGFRNR